MAILAISEIKFLNVLKTGKILRTIIHLNKKYCHNSLRIPYAGVQGETLIKNLVRKLKRHIDKPFKLRNIYRTKKLSYYCNTKDKVPEYLKSHILHEFCSPACNIKYIGKTDQNFGTRVQEHSGLDIQSFGYRYTIGLQSFVVM